MKRCHFSGRVKARPHSYRIRHVFAAIEQMGGKLLRTLGQARANVAMTMMAAGHDLKRRVYVQKAGIKAC